MSKSAQRRGRKRRRQAAMVIRSGGKFKVGHTLIAGRTGHVHAKKMRSRRTP